MAVLPYRAAVHEVVAALGSDGARGIEIREARARLDRDGPNALTAERPVPAWLKFLAQFRNVLVLLLLAAAAISAGLWAYERDASAEARERDPARERYR